MMARHGLGLMVLGGLVAGAAFAAQPRLLAPGIISTEEHNEFGLALSPDGNTAYFTRGDDIYISSRVAGEWASAKRAPFNSNAFDGDPFVTLDGQRLYFMSERRGSQQDPADPRAQRQADVWITTRQGNGTWAPPVNAGLPINTASIEGHTSVTADGTLYYFSGHSDGLGGHDLYRSVAARNGEVVRENLGAPINSEHGDGHPYIAPDESYLLFYSHRPGGLGSCDLYISFSEGERWTPPQNLGPDINSEDCEMTPHVSPDGKSLYFARIHSDGGRDLYVVDFSADRWRRRGRDIARRFQQGTVSNGDEFAIAFAPDGKTAYLTQRSAPDGPPTFNIVRTDLSAGRWSKPVSVAFNSAQRDADPFVSPDGSRLFFMSTRPVDSGPSKDGDYDLWQVALGDDGQWGEARHLGPEVNTAEAWEGFPTVTEHGTYFTPISVLYFFSERDGGLGESDIYRAELEDGSYRQPRNVGAPVNSPYWDGLPYVGPDETFLIFSSDRPGGYGEQDLYVSYRADDGSWTEPENLGPGVNTHESELFPHVTPKGEHLFFSRFHADGERHIYYVETASTGLQLDVSGHYDLKHSNPAWSPDGGRIVFDTNRSGNYDIFLVDRDGEAFENLTKHPAKDRHPSWSPDGSWIAFDSDRLGSADIWIAGPEGKALRRLTDDSADEIRPVWSPDGEHLVFGSNRSGDWEVYVANRDGSSPVNISRNPGFDMPYSWSPDGEWVAFESDRNGNGSRDIFSMRLDGSDVQTLTNDPAVDRWPDYSPDGQRIAFCSDRGNTKSWDLYIMDRDGGDKTAVFASTGIDWTPKWSPDGSSLVFASRHGSERHLYTLSLKHFQLRRLTRDADGVTVAP